MLSPRVIAVTIFLLLSRHNFLFVYSLDWRRIREHLFVSPRWRGLLVFWFSFPIAIFLHYDHGKLYALFFTFWRFWFWFNYVQFLWFLYGCLKGRSFLCFQGMNVKVRIYELKNPDRGWRDSIVGRFLELHTAHLYSIHCAPCNSLSLPEVILDHKSRSKSWILPSVTLKLNNPNKQNSQTCMSNDALRYPEFILVHFNYQRKFSFLPKFDFYKFFLLVALVLWSAPLGMFLLHIV